MARKSHIPQHDCPVTYCGLRYADGGLIVIDLKRVSIESATCRNCQRSDDARVVRNHERECREAGIDPCTMEPLRKP